MNFLTPEQVASILQVNKMTVYREIKRGKLKAYKFGKEFRISDMDFEAYLHNAYKATEESLRTQCSCIAGGPKTLGRPKTIKQTTSKKMERLTSKDEESKKL